MLGLKSEKVAKSSLLTNSKISRRQYSLYYLAINYIEFMTLSTGQAKNPHEILQKVQRIIALILLRCLAIKNPRKSPIILSGTQKSMIRHSPPEADKPSRGG